AVNAQAPDGQDQQCGDAESGGRKLVLLHHCHYGTIALFESSRSWRWWSHRISGEARTLCPAVTRVSLAFQPFQVSPQLSGSLITQIAVLLECFPDDFFQVGRQIGI